MLVSKDRKFVFIHVPKTGGTSLVSVLKKASDRPILPLRAVGYMFDDNGIKLPEWTYSIFGYPYHVRSEQLLRIWGEEEYGKYFSFAFVRNPWDLVVSEYHYILRKKSHHLNKVVSKFGSFKEYLYWKESNYARQQTDWLCSPDGRLIVDSIGRFESYEADANGILAKLGIEESVPHKNSTVRNDYREYYDSESRELVGKLHANDIDVFGYLF